MPFSLVKKKCHVVDVSDDVTTTQVIRRVNDKIFSVLILLCPQVTHNKTICEENPV